MKQMLMPLRIVNIAERNGFPIPKRLYVDEYVEVGNSNAVGRIRKKPRINRNLEKVNKDGLNSISWVITVR